MRTEEHVLEDDRLLREPAEAVSVGGIGVGDRLALDARPGEVDIEEQEEDAETDDGGLLQAGSWVSRRQSQSFKT